MPSQPKPHTSLKEFKQRMLAEGYKKEKEWLAKYGFTETVEPVEVAGQPVTVANPCSTGKSASILPLKRTHALPSIPSTPTGCIDTIGAMIRFPPARKDIEKLRQQAGWTVITREAGKVKQADGHEKPIKAKLSLRRESDDLRVWVYNDGVRVEVSIPRVLGLTNDKQGRVTECQAIEVFESVTAKLFPLTTARAAISGESMFGWRVTRLDLAKNFKASFPELLEDLRFAHHPGIRAEPETHGRTGLSIYGENFEASFYSLSERVGRGVVKSSKKGKQFAPTNASLIRFEFRFRSTQALDYLAQQLPLDRGGLPFRVTCATGEQRIFRLGFTNHLLQQILAREAQSLGSLTSRQLKGAESWKPLFRLGLLYLVDQPWAWSLVKENYGERRVRDLKKVVASLRLARRDVELTRVIWSAPQITPALRASLVEQRSRMPLSKMHA